VTIVAPNATRRELLRTFLEANGWSVCQESDGRRVLRGWSPEQATPLLFVELDASNVESFELLAALAAHRISPRVLVVAEPELTDALLALGVVQVLPPRCRFSEIARALEEVRTGAVTRAA
jgi:DNA-binding NarL/FixJ family response regulator